jgi:hypothetical protein
MTEGRVENPPAHKPPSDLPLVGAQVSLLCPPKSSDSSTQQIIVDSKTPSATEDRHGHAMSASRVLCK